MIQSFVPIPDQDPHHAQVRGLGGVQDELAGGEGELRVFFIFILHSDS